MAAVMVAARNGWFDSYAWIVRANPDVRIEDASFLAARLRKPTVDAVLVRCRPRAPSICTDFFAARPTAFNHTAWGRSRKKNGRINNVPAQRPGVRFDLPRRSMTSGSPVDGRRSSPRSTSSGPPSTAGVRPCGTSSAPTGRGAAAAAASAGGASITTTRCVDGRGSLRRRKVCTGTVYKSTLYQVGRGCSLKTTEPAPASARLHKHTRSNASAALPRTSNQPLTKGLQSLQLVKGCLGPRELASPSTPPEQPWASSTRRRRCRRSRPGAPPSGPSKGSGRCRAGSE